MGSGGAEELGGNVNAGGGEVLQYIGQSHGKKKFLFMDNELIRQLESLPYIRVVIILLIIFIVFLIIAQIIRMKNPRKGKTIINELEHLDEVKKHDKKILVMNRMLNTFTKIVEVSPFKFQQINRDYMEYNLERANVRIPGGFRVMKPEEFNAVVILAQASVIAVAILVMVTMSTMLAVIMIGMALFIGGVMPMAVIRNTVKLKDQEVVANFADFYLMLHYSILSSSGTPLAQIMKSYDKTTSSEEMHRLVAISIQDMETYGEYQGTRYIAKSYREVQEIQKLMRLIRQSNEGGDVRAELMSFRQEVLDAKRYSMEVEMRKIIEHARLSFNILALPLIQAIISAMGVYFKDLQLTSMLVG